MMDILSPIPLQYEEMMLKIPTVDEWFNLSLKYRDFHRVSHTVLKDYGYMAIMDYLDERPDAHRILEFGHGFNATLFERYGRQRDVWGIDDCQGLSYFTADPVEWERRLNDEVRSKSPNCTFRRGLLGGESEGDLPQNYFDVICSVSVLEEVPIQTVRDILAHAAKLVKPGGVLIGTHDLVIDFPARIGEYAAAHAEAGFDLEHPHPYIDLGGHRLLLESPTTAMLWYQAHEGEGRKYWGHWTTMWTVAKKI
jgi:SAM-dependent methyltransferase